MSPRTRLLALVPLLTAAKYCRVLGSMITWRRIGDMVGDGGMVVTCVVREED